MVRLWIFVSVKKQGKSVPYYLNSKRRGKLGTAVWLAAGTTKKIKYYVLKSSYTTPKLISGLSTNNKWQLLLVVDRGLIFENLFVELTCEILSSSSSALW